MLILLGVVVRMFVSPCAYQGGKSRIAKQIVDVILKNYPNAERYWDLCCGSGAISLELLNRGIDANKIYMVDLGCYGQFWQSIADSSFDMWFKCMVYNSYARFMEDESSCV